MPDDCSLSRAGSPRETAELTNDFNEALEHDKDMRKYPLLYTFYNVLKRQKRNKNCTYFYTDANIVPMHLTNLCEFGLTDRMNIIFVPSASAYPMYHKAKPMKVSRPKQSALFDEFSKRRAAPTQLSLLLLPPPPPPLSFKWKQTLSCV
uniref:Uncharacterized protein n=1 Tax=Romanomermis culicivorax TaxID=13658 RepID=A0A915KMR8_ROMCU